MAILHFRSIERRRTTRASVCMSVVVRGHNLAGETFKFWSKTLSVSQHGGMFGTTRMLEQDQEFEVFNEHSGKKATARVASVRQEKGGQLLVAFEFVEGGERFWSMTFPVSGAKPMRRAGIKKASGE